MWKKHASKILWVLVASGFLLIPVADERVIKTIPLYPLDYISLAIIGISMMLLYKERALQDQYSLLKIVSLFFVLVASCFLSLYLNGLTATGMGQIKSWIVLPGLAGLVTAFVFRKHKYRDQNLLSLWYTGLLALLAMLLPYFYLGQFTFDGRLQGPFTSPNFLASFLFPGVIFSVYFCQKAVLRDAKFLYFILAGAFLYALFLTHSFGGWLALGGAITWYGFRTKAYTEYKKYILAVIFITALFVGAELITSEKLSGIFNERSSLASRLIIWSVAGQALQDHPLTGIGMGKFQEVYLRYQEQYPPYLEWAVPQPHSIFLALWLQLGLVGFIITLWLIQKAIRERRNAKEYILLQALFIGMLIYGIFDTPLFGNALAFVWWFTLSLLLFPVREREK